MLCTRARRYVLLLLLLLALAAGMTPGWASPRSTVTPSTVTFEAAADTYVEASTPATNFGASTHMVADASPLRRLLLRFDVTGLGGTTVTAARLRLWVTNGSPYGGEFHKLSSSFAERTVTWNSKPAFAPGVVGTLGAVAAGRWVELDVSSAVKGAGTVYLGALSGNSDGASYATREAAAVRAPQLVVTLGGTQPPPGPLSIGAYYYPWYGADGRHWQDGYLRRRLTTPQSPLLGEYDSRNPQTISRHFQWAQQYGINTFITSWPGAGSYEDGTVHDYLLKSTAIGSTSIAIFYESLALLPQSNGLIDFNNAATGQKLLSDVDYLARTYFANPHYQRVSGRPVLYFYVTRTWRGNYAQAIANVRSTIKARYGYDLFLIGDEVDPDSAVTPQRIKLFDAITGYTMYSDLQPPGWPDDTGWLAKVRQRYDAFKSVADQYGVAFIPDATPGFNDRGVRVAANHYALPREVNATTPAGTDSLLTQMLNVDVPYLDPNLRTLNVTSFNEWHEDTQIEPAASAAAGSTPTTYTQGYSYPSDGTRPLELLNAWRASHGG